MNVNKAWKVKYTLKNGSLINDGHTMFLEDAVTDLNYYYNRFTAGQKILSSEVREVIEGLLDLVRNASCGYSIECDSDKKIILLAKKLLEAYQ